jgi:hypothetical protein
MTDIAVKTQVMDAIKEALKTIPEVKTVERIPAKGIDLDVAPMPAIFFYDDDENRDRRNRIAIGEIQIIVFGYVPLLMEGYDDINPLVDLIQGRIHEVMAKNAFTGQPLIQNIIEGKVHRDYPNDEYLLLIMQFTVIYSHNWGDAFSNAGY